MKLLAGIVLGIALSIPIRAALNRYADHSLPPAYTGPKIIAWQHGIRIEETSQ